MQEKRRGEFMKNVDDDEDDDSNPFAYVLLIGLCMALHLIITEGLIR